MAGRGYWLLLQLPAMYAVACVVCIYTYPEEFLACGYLDTIVRSAKVTRSAKIQEKALGRSRIRYSGKCRYFQNASQTHLADDRHLNNRVRAALLAALLEGIRQEVNTLQAT